MDHDQWRLLMRQVRRAAATLPRPARRFDYPDTLVVGMYLWAVAHDRPMCWACDPLHYNAVFRPRQRLPWVSQFHRRVRSDRVRQVLQHVHDVTAGRQVPTALASVDGKPLPISPVSKDPDARRGYAGGGRRGMGKGYKLHALISEDRRVICWSVRPMNEHEMPVARRLLAALPTGFFSPRSLLLADGNYDSHDLHKDVHARGGRLVTNLRGRARHAVTLRQMGVARRELLMLDQTVQPLVRLVARHRNEAAVSKMSVNRFRADLFKAEPQTSNCNNVTDSDEFRTCETSASKQRRMNIHDLHRQRFPIKGGHGTSADAIRRSVARDRRERFVDLAYRVETGSRDLQPPADTQPDHWGK